MDTPKVVFRPKHTTPFLGIVFDGDAEPLTEIPAQTPEDARGRALSAWSEAQAAYDKSPAHNRPVDPPMWDVYSWDEVGNYRRFDRAQPTHQ